MSDIALIRKIEALSMNAQPALKTVQQDGWILRFANGYTKRANSINPLYPSCEELDRKIEACEQMYRKQHLPAVYKLTAAAFPGELDRSLHAKGYDYVGETSVQILSLSQIGEKPEAYVEICPRQDRKWFDHYCRWNHVCEADQQTLKQMFDNIAAETCYMLITDKDGIPCACGLGVLEDEYIGLFDIVTKKKERKQGYGTQLIQHLLHWGKENGAAFAYLQVVRENKPALALYTKLGFDEMYTYWYRVKS
ncbi:MULTISPECIES: GNAT family N-acetyltransferase [Shouchella]|uniref:GNAT family N-acetyltransferase n=1 Tax=Shouchella TaxID=2893057 RepID=UPI0009E25AEF|nr:MULTISPECIES: GNAT family N-acetyltransferase [Shouchella]MCM3381481.1 GNAT family N-acetyltransferase [Shouchella rhizosphaerae]PAD45541.1 N-acetyltransferase [Shouchella clausii]PAE82943.1 N-acetyltransferase [Shouchella clausii]